MPPLRLKVRSLMVQMTVLMVDVMMVLVVYGGGINDDKRSVRSMTTCVDSLTVVWALVLDMPPLRLKVKVRSLMVQMTVLRTVLTAKAVPHFNDSWRIRVTDRSVENPRSRHAV